LLEHPERFGKIIVEQICMETCPAMDSFSHIAFKYEDQQQEKDHAAVLSKRTVRPLSSKQEHEKVKTR
jgi:hypothetical protein